MIDAVSLKAHLRFSLQHYGTRTQGEDYRMDQVAEYLTELILRIQVYEQAMEEAGNNFNESIAAQFKLSIS